MQKLLHSKILGEGKPLLIFHGLFGMGDNWMTLGRKFAQQFQVHLIDLRNHGRSFHCDEMDYEHMVQDVVNYCQFHELESIFLVGHSMGGKVAMHLAMLHSNLVNKLIVVDIAPKPYKDRHHFIFKAMQTVDFKQDNTREKVAEKLSEIIKNQGVLQFLLKNVYRKGAALAWRFNLDVLEKNYSLLNENLPPFSTFEKPTLFIKGSLSDYIVDTDNPLIHAHFPQTEIIEIPQAGHWVHAEQPLVFYEKVLTFLL
jgi:pimeloyl-ACP methyl ester carboxylesterase